MDLSSECAGVFCFSGAGAVCRLCRNRLAASFWKKSTGFHIVYRTGLPYFVY